MEENCCVCCGGIIPEGRMLCPECETNRYPVTTDDFPEVLKKVLETYMEE